MFLSLALYPSRASKKGDVKEGSFLTLKISALVCAAWSAGGLSGTFGARNWVSPWNREVTLHLCNVVIQPR
jgi:hypothetical protein